MPSTRRPCTTTPPPTPVPRITPKTTWAPAPPPSTASESAKQLASLAIFTGRSSTRGEVAAQVAAVQPGGVAHGDAAGGAVDRAGDADADGLDAAAGLGLEALEQAADGAGGRRRSRSAGWGRGRGRARRRRRRGRCPRSWCRRSRAPAASPPLPGFSPEYHGAAAAAQQRPARAVFHTASKRSTPPPSCPAVRKHGLRLPCLMAFPALG